MGSGAHLGSHYSEGEGTSSRRAPLGHLLPDDVRQVRFARATLRAGYNLDEVDEFLDRVERQLLGGPGRPARPLTAQDVIEQRFRATRFRAGYDQDEVDDFLDRIVTELRRAH
jgi:DivIVA domain-containing protein